MNLTPADLERARLIAEAERERRLRQGEWSAGVTAHQAYQTRPLEWIVEYLGVPIETLRWSMNPGYGRHKWDGDRDPIVQILEGLAAGEDVGVESATGTGKTFIAACIVFWFLACFEDSLVVTTAPKKDQLYDNLWKEIGALFPRFQRHFPQAQLLTGKVRLKPAEGGKEKWAATAFVAGVGADEESATKAQGSHAEHMLHIVEEMPGVHPAIITAIENTRTDDHNLMLGLGNPDHQHDPLHQFCVQEHVRHIRISALDHPNIVSRQRVVPGAIGPKRLKQRTAKYGKGSRLYESRIRGVSPKEAEDALILWAWCEAAAARYNDPAFREGGLALGVDVADKEGGDEAAISRWQGACCTEVASYEIGPTHHISDATELGQKVYLEATDMLNPVDPRHIGVDEVGVGAATVNELRRVGMKVRGIGGGKKSVPGLDTELLWSEVATDAEGRMRPKGSKVIEAERFDNQRSQVWWRLREDLRLGRIAIPHDEELFYDLTTPKYDTQGGKIRVESKEDIKKTLKRSPNKGDACAYGNWVRPRRPLRQEAKREPVRSRNRDRGLERLLERQEKIRKRREREQLRFLRSLAKERDARLKGRF